MKEFSIDTNFNNKLECNIFLHISTAPLEAIPESGLGKPIRILTKDDSHAPVTCRLLEFARIRMDDLVSVDTYASYGLDEFAFKDWWFKKYPSTTLETMMAIYIYEKITPEQAQLLLDKLEVAPMLELTNSEKKVA